MKQLIVTADDFGLSPGVNEGVVRGHRNGIVTSASLMVHGDAALDAVERARDLPGLAVGLHIDLGEWRFDGSEWVVTYERVDLGDARAVRLEVRRQAERFAALVGGPPTHLDSHQHVHRRPTVAEPTLELAHELDVPLRGAGAIRYVGDFYGQTDTGESYPEWVGVEHLVELIAELDDGVTELGCHPATQVDFDAAYARERLVELESLCDGAIAAALRRHEVDLTAFGDTP